MSYPNQLYHMEYSYFNWLPKEICEYLFNTFLNIEEEKIKNDVLPIDDILIEDINTLAKLKHKIQQLELRIDILKRNNYQHDLQYVDNVMKQIEKRKESNDKAIIILDETDGIIQYSSFRRTPLINVNEFRNKNLFVYNEIVKKYLIKIELIYIFMNMDKKIYLYNHPTDSKEYSVIFIDDEMKKYNFKNYVVDIDYGDLDDIYYSAKVYAIIIDFKKQYNYQTK